tara:strand:- start:488 stop:721 length:234 start_codon:yes stop_codon:yes gene_type:complete
MVILGYDILADNNGSNFNHKGTSMTDIHRQLLDKITTIQSEDRPSSTYEDSETYEKTLADASIMLEDEIRKLKSRVV